MSPFYRSCGAARQGEENKKARAQRQSAHPGQILRIPHTQNNTWAFNRDASLTRGFTALCYLLSVVFGDDELVLASLEAAGLLSLVDGFSSLCELPVRPPDGER